MMQLTRRKALCGALGGLAGAALFARQRPALAEALAEAPPPTVDVERLVRTGRALGTEVSITVLHGDAAAARRALDDAFEELARIEAVLSLYRPDSQVSRLNRDGRRGKGGALLDDADPHLLAVLHASLDMSRRSGGAFDVTVQPLWDLFSRAARAKALPADDEVADARRRVDHRAIEVRGRRVTLAAPASAITFNGIAQGYATDRALAVLRAAGIRRALVDVGELGALGPKAPGQPWKAGIQHPRIDDAYAAVARLADRCLATSGDYATSFSDDRRHHHIFDPATGRSPTELASVSVAAPSATLADALSTAVFVLGADRGSKLIRATPGCDALFVFKDGKVAATPEFPT